MKIFITPFFLGVILPQRHKGLRKVRKASSTQSFANFAFNKHNTVKKIFAPLR